MQFVNDDMDDLFRKAAEDYPLNTKGSDWDKVHQQLQADKGTNEKFDRRHYLWLLLLLPFTFICNKYVGRGEVDVVHQAALPSSSNSFSASDKDAESQQERTSFIQNRNQEEEKEIKQNKIEPFSNTKRNSQIIIADKAVNKNSKQNKVLETVAYTSSRKQKEINDLKQTDRVPKQRENKNFVADDVAITNSTIPVMENPAAQNDVNKEPDTNKQEKPALKEEEKKPIIQPDTTVSQKQKPVKTKQKQVYIGLLAGPDVSGVKTSKVQGAGYSFGLVAGVTLNKWSAETGLLLDKKMYYAEGKYFDVKKMMLSNHATVIDGDGTCYMLELPLNVRYAFVALPNKKHGWYAAAGMSSYLMKKEDYSYYYDLYGTKYYADKSYKNSSKNWFSIMNISMGYQHKLGKGLIRVEPYVKIPVKGVGISSLPMSSAGVFIIVTKPVH